MTKNPDFQKELLEKVKPGTKPSHLKRSKSLNDMPSPLSEKVRDFVPQAPPLPFTNPSELEQLKKQTDLNALLNEQLKERQQEVEELRKQLEANNSPEETLSELDRSLMARHQSLKDWFTKYRQTRDLETELDENIEQASTELVSQDEKISALRSQVSQLKKTNQSLTRDLDSAQGLAQFCKNPYFSPQPDYPLLKYALYSLAVAVFSLWLTNSQKKPNG